MKLFFETFEHMSYPSVSKCGACVGQILCFSLYAVNERSNNRVARTQYSDERAFQRDSHMCIAMSSPAVHDI